jgi:hypothetical protein
VFYVFRDLNFLGRLSGRPMKKLKKFCDIKILIIFSANLKKIIIKNLGLGLNSHKKAGSLTTFKDSGSPTLLFTIH